MAETCRKSRCDAPAGARCIILLNPDGSDGRTCGPYCDDHTADLLDLLLPTYTGGGDAYRIEETDR